MRLFGIACILLAVCIAYLMLKTTPRASIRASRYDRQAMWGMIRRLFYVSIAGGNFGMGWWVLDNMVDVPVAVVAFWLMMTTPIAIFLVLRAAHLIDQDYWIGTRRGRRPTTVHEAADEIRDVVKDIQNPARRNRALHAISDLDALCNS